MGTRMEDYIQMSNPDEMDPIDLRELVLHLWKERVLISVILLITIGLSFVYAFIIQDPIYEASASILFKVPAPVKTEDSEIHYQTAYGQYMFPSQNAADYFQYAKSNDLIAALQATGKYDISAAALRSGISVQTNLDSNLIDLIVKSEDPALALAMNQDLTRLFTENIRILYKKNALDYFQNKIDTDLEIKQAEVANLESILSTQNQMLKQMEPTYKLKKMLLSDPVIAAAYAKTNQTDLEHVAYTVIEEEYLNDSFVQLEIQITETQNQLIALKQDLITLQNQKEALNQELALYTQKIGTPAQSELLGGQLDVLASNLIVISQPTLPQNPVAPDRLLQLAIGTLLGLMLALVVALVKKWWQEPRTHETVKPNVMREDNQHGQ